MQAGPLLRLPANAKPTQSGALRTIPPLSSGCKRIVSITDNDGYDYDSSIAHGRLQSTIDVIAKFHVALLPLREPWRLHAGINVLHERGRL
jgi:hypothetical protein